MQLFSRPTTTISVDSAAAAMRIASMDGIAVRENRPKSATLMVPLQATAISSAPAQLAKVGFAC